MIEREASNSPVPPTDWPRGFEERYRYIYEYAVACSYNITQDFQASEDVVQGALIALGDMMKSGKDLTRPTFLWMIRNRSIDAIRDKIRRRKIGRSESEFGSSNDEGNIIPFLETLPDQKTLQPDDAAVYAEVDDEALILLRRIRASLSCRQKAVFDHVVAEVPHEEAGQRLGISGNAHKLRWARICA